jgi:uncharacterized protein with NAD-binding domain and iron-sulfur cluster
LAEIIAGFRATVRLLLAGRVPGDMRDRRVWVLSDLLATIAIGILRDDLVVRGFEAVDEEEFSAWLERHGADPTITLRSNIVRVLYDLMFAYAGGRDDRPNIAAGTGARTFLLVVGGYSGSIMFKMQSGMGDTIFTPLYGILKARGVRFEFFHRVERIRPGDSGTIDEVHVTRQVDIKPEVLAQGGYEPLFRGGDFDVWPAAPRVEQIVDGEKLRSDPFDPGRPYDLESRWTSWPNAGARVLRRGEDFDLVVCGIPLGDECCTATAFIPHSPRCGRRRRRSGFVARRPSSAGARRRGCAKPGSAAKPHRSSAAISSPSIPGRT